MKKILLIIFIFLLAPIFLVKAHGVGTTVEQVSGDYILDFDYETLEIVQGDQVRYNFNIKNKDTKEQVDFASVWTRVEQNKKVLFATGIVKPKFGPTGVLYVFDKPGEYQMFVRFEQPDKSLVEFQVPLSVKGLSVPGKKSSPLPYIGSGVVGLLLGIFLIKFLNRK